MTAAAVRVSVVVIVTERPDPLAEFYQECAEPLRAGGHQFEFLFVSPTSSGHRLDPLLPLRAAGESIELFEAAHDPGEASLLRSVLPHCQGQVILALSAYRRVAATALPMLIEGIDAGADLVTARRSTTGDSRVNRVQRRMTHALIHWLVGSAFHDLGSGVRAFRPEMLRDLPLYGEFYRFLPVFARRDGFRVEELEVPQHAADRRSRVYSPGVYLRRLLDLLAVFFLVRFREKPLRFFGLVGGMVGFLGFVILAVLGVQRLGGEPLADRPMLLVGALLLVLGAQGIALGLVGEIIVHAGAARSRVYRLARRDAR